MKIYTPAVISTLAGIGYLSPLVFDPLSVAALHHFGFLWIVAAWAILIVHLFFITKGKRENRKAHFLSLLMTFIYCIIIFVGITKGFFLAV
ncbi:hypothetical protein MLD52_22745 [Puniceicoccaceae bacterium K14]|nr:hypothetical protein [Puniceicoccaceae bacterium K14]